MENQAQNKNSIKDENNLLKFYLSKILDVVLCNRQVKHINTVCGGVKCLPKIRAVRFSQHQCLLPLYPKYGTVERN